MAQTSRDKSAEPFHHDYVGAVIFGVRTELRLAFRENICVRFLFSETTTSKSSNKPSLGFCELDDVLVLRNSSSLPYVRWNSMVVAKMPEVPINTRDGGFLVLLVKRRYNLRFLNSDAR